MSEEGIILGFFAAFFGILLFGFIVAVILYILYGIGMYKIAGKEGRGDLAWLAWIPIGNFFILPLVVENYVHKDLRGKFTLIFGIAFVVSFVFSWVFAPFGFIYLILFIYAFYVLALRYSDNAIVHLIISIITLGASVPISVFRLRNRDPKPVAEDVAN